MIVTTLLGASLLAGPQPVLAPSPDAGVRVESVEKEMPADRAGLRPGDVLVAWSRALRIREALAPESLEVATSVNSLGIVAAQRREPERASLLGRALALRQRWAPHSLSTAKSLSNLAIVMRHDGELAAALDLLRQSLDIASKLDPLGSSVAAALTNLGAVEQQRGNSAAAEAYFQKALARAEQREPGGRTLASNLNNLGDLALQRGDGEAAESYYRRSLALLRRWGPGAWKRPETRGRWRCCGGWLLSASGSPAPTIASASCTVARSAGWRRWKLTSRPSPSWKRMRVGGRARGRR